MRRQPSDGLAGVAAAQVHRQINRASASLLHMPIEEPRSRDRDRALFRAPLRPISPIPLGAQGRQDNFQRNLSHCVRFPPEVVSRHADPITPS
jgi:hypothetical protein